MKYPVILICFLFALNSAIAQDSTRVLFVGNSFTYFNNMPQMVKSFADSAHIPMSFAMHAPGGVSVGDTAQGTMAHMNNPVLFALIRSKKWDYVVIQDNQGRFVRDSAQFPGASKVVEGHIKIMDSVKAVNSCAKIILFGGWGLQNGQPPYGNTGVEMIQRILRNYVVLNDTMKEIVAPIGEAWIRAINHFTAVNLWNADQAHPANEGSYLTASVIFSTIFNKPNAGSTHLAGIASATASVLRAFADSVVYDASNFVKYNVGGNQFKQVLFGSNQFSVAGNNSAYLWFRDKTFLGISATQSYSGSGNYYAVVKVPNGCWVKTCYLNGIGLSQSEENTEAKVLRLFPNPSNGQNVYLNIGGDRMESLTLYNSEGSEVSVDYTFYNGWVQLEVNKLPKGFYWIMVKQGGKQQTAKLVVN